MRDEYLEEESTPKKKRSFAGILCRILGTLILLVAFGSTLPVIVPRFLGYEIYHIVSGSMEPTIPVGSAVYVKDVEPTEVQSGDIIAFMSEGSIVVHRVVVNYTFEAEFTTKGDANEIEDFSEIPYDHLIGVVKYHIPMLGQVLMILTSTMGRVLLVCFAACGALLNIIGGRLD